ncbi:MAG: hypothetical protein FJ405_03350 [Verrucomicrobia bacterium]|nr:hypothetical protein [Verrucomicrobiota bacterium]
MRRFSQKNSLVTLNDINITPLLDLAFVLLIIFVITTPLLEQGLDLSLPEGGVKDRELQKTDIKTIDVSNQGKYVMGSRPMSLSEIEAALTEAKRRNPKLVVYIRCDKKTAWEHPMALMDRLEQRGIKDYSFRFSPSSR